jgi:hypothetical protein
MIQQNRNGGWMHDHQAKPSKVDVDLSLAQQARHTMSLASAARATTPSFSSTKFLNIVLTHIRTEISVMGIKDASPGDPRRLQIYRDVFGNNCAFKLVSYELLSNVLMLPICASRLLHPPF